MTNKEFIKKVSEETGRTQKEIKEILDSVEVTLKNYVSEMQVNDKVKVADMTFTKKEVSERERRNPRTGETFISPKTNKVSIKLSKDFKEMVKK